MINDEDSYPTPVKKDFLFGFIVSAVPVIVQGCIQAAETKLEKKDEGIMKITISSGIIFLLFVGRKIWECCCIQKPVANFKKK